MLCENVPQALYASIFFMSWYQPHAANIYAVSSLGYSAAAASLIASMVRNHEMEHLTLSCVINQRATYVIARVPSKIRSNAP